MAQRLSNMFPTRTGKGGYGGGQPDLSRDGELAVVVGKLRQARYRRRNRLSDKALRRRELAVVSRITLATSNTPALPGGAGRRMPLPQIAERIEPHSHFL